MKLESAAYLHDIYFRLLTERTSQQLNIGNPINMDIIAIVLQKTCTDPTSFTHFVLLGCCLTQYYCPFAVSKPTITTVLLLVQFSQCVFYIRFHHIGIHFCRMNAGVAELLLHEP